MCPLLSNFYLDCNRLSVRRDHILEDAYDQIMKEPARALQRNRLEVQFAGEEGSVH